MRTILFILRKEFKQIFRNKGMLPIIFVMPFVQLFLLSYAATYEIKNINFYVVDKDKSDIAGQLVNKISGSKYFTLINVNADDNAANESLISNESDLVLNIPKDFEKSLVNKNNPEVQVIINAIDGSKAGIISSYILTIINDFNSDIAVNNGLLQQKSPMNITFSDWYNPKLNYKTFMVPGILVILISVVGMFLTAMNVAKEKEIGTIEQLNVTPIKKYQFIMGKLIPFWVIALCELSFGLTFAYFVFSLPIVGSIFTLFIAASLYLVVMLSLGLFISTISETQQQAMFIAWFILMVFLFLSGLFNAIENMPMWAQYLTKLVPISYFMTMIRNILLKGSNLIDLKDEVIALSIYAFFILSFALWKYKKVS